MRALPKGQPNSPSWPPSFPTHQAQGLIPRIDWQLDFTHMPSVKHYRYLLVLVDTFSSWVEAFPTTNKRAQTVSTISLSEIIPHFGVPTSLQSDNGHEFISQVSQTTAKALNPWHFHIPYHPQSSGKVERTNRTLKSILTKLSIELHLNWTKLLLLALLQFHDLP